MSYKFESGAAKKKTDQAALTFPFLKASLSMPMQYFLAVVDFGAFASCSTKNSRSLFDVVLRVLFRASFLLPLLGSNGTYSTVNSF